MKKLTSLMVLSLLAVSAAGAADQKDSAGGSYFIDVHELGPGNVTAAAVADAHQKDLAVQQKYDVRFIDYWVDEKNGRVYCLSQAKDAHSITDAHREAHGLLPSKIMAVSQGKASAELGGREMFLDVHELGPGNVSAAAVADAHEKDLKAEKEFGVNFINYWVDELDGTVICLSEAPSADGVVATHQHAHGLLPVSVSEVKNGG